LNGSLSEAVSENKALLPNWQCPLKLDRLAIETFFLIYGNELAWEGLFRIICE
jgi:hypothetical protein